MTPRHEESARRGQVLDALLRNGASGLTWKELSEEIGLHHGQASGALSGLHKDNRIARLTLRRERCSVYVLHEFVQERATEPYGRKRKTHCPYCGRTL